MSTISYEFQNLRPADSVFVRLIRDANLSPRFKHQLPRLKNTYTIAIRKNARREYLSNDLKTSVIVSTLSFLLNIRMMTGIMLCLLVLLHLMPLHCHDKCTMLLLSLLRMMSLFPYLHSLTHCVAKLIKPPLMVIWYYLWNHIWKKKLHSLRTY